MTWMTHKIHFSIGRTDWFAEIEYRDRGGTTGISDPEWNIDFAQPDFPGAQLTVEGPDLDILGGMVTGPDGTCSFRPIRSLVEEKIQESLDDIAQSYREYTEEC